MKIKVLGSGCAKCNKLYEATNNALEELNIQADVVKDEDMMSMMSYGIVRTPALVINGKAVLSGRLPSGEELKGLIKEHADAS